MEPDWSLEPEPLQTTEELVRSRLALLAEVKELHVAETRVEGSTSFVYDCSYDGHPGPKMLKVSKMRDGLSRIETDAFQRLTGMPGIPQLVRIFRLNDRPETVIATVSEKIEGRTIPKHIAADNKSAFAVMANLQTFIDTLHKRGFALPSDWLKEDNWLVTKDNEVHLIDLGEMRTLGNLGAEARPTMASDVRGFHNLAEQYRPMMKRREWKTIERKLSSDYSSLSFNPGSPYDR